MQVTLIEFKSSHTGSQGDRKMRKTALLALVGLTALDSFAIAAEPATTEARQIEARRVEAQQVANQALAAEAEGDFIARQRLLRESEMLDKDCSAGEKSKR